MIEANFNTLSPGVGSEGVEQSGTAAKMPRSSTYCVDCGSWGEHETECVCCGYDFRASARKTARSNL